MSGDNLVALQLEHLDDTDVYATAWKEAVEHSQSKFVPWGGRGKGGRGFARRTFQPKDCLVPNVRLEYVGQTNQEPRLLLENAELKLHPGQVYALIGKNGSGKSSLLRRMHAKKIAGFPTHIVSFYSSQDTMFDLNCTALEWILTGYQKHNTETRRAATEALIDALQCKIDELDVGSEDPSAMEQMERLAEQISNLEDGLNDESPVEDQAKEALEFMGVSSSLHDASLTQLTSGQRQKVSLALALLCSDSSDLILLDEKTKFLDVPGLICLRQLVATISKKIVVIVSHDSDFLFDSATAIVALEDLGLKYYVGNYADYLERKEEEERHEEKSYLSFEKKQTKMKQTLENLRRKPVPKRGGAKKKARQISSHKKKMHRYLQQPTYVKRYDEPDKSIQFSFRKCSCQWNEPLIRATDVGHSYDPAARNAAEAGVLEASNEELIIFKKKGFLFDCIELCIDEGRTYCILGENGSGTTTLLKILAKHLQPSEGRIDHALNVEVAFIEQEAFYETLLEQAPGTNSLTFLKAEFPQKTEQELRGELINFGLSPQQATTDVRFLSGGERCRLTLAASMLNDPHVIVWDQPTSNLDVASVDALIFGLKQWNGTIVFVSGDAHFVRQLESSCYVLMADEGKLRKVNGGIDEYIKSF